MGKFLFLADGELQTIEAAKAVEQARRDAAWHREQEAREKQEAREAILAEWAEACRTGEPRRIEAARKAAGAGMTTMDQEGASSLFYLIEGWGRAAAKPDGRTLLQINSHYQTAFERMEQAGAVIHNTAQDQATLLHWAAAHGSRAAVDYLIERGMDPAAKTTDGKTPAAYGGEQGSGKPSQADALAALRYLEREREQEAARKAMREELAESVLAALSVIKKLTLGPAIAAWARIDHRQTEREMKIDLAQTVYRAAPPDAGKAITKTLEALGLNDMSEQGWGFADLTRANLPKLLAALPLLGKPSLDKSREQIASLPADDAIVVLEALEKAGWWLLIDDLEQSRPLRLEREEQLRIMEVGGVIPAQPTPTLLETAITPPINLPLLRFFTGQLERWQARQREQQGDL